MTSACSHCIQTLSIMPSAFIDKEVRKELRTPHIYFKDNYEKYFKRYGITRNEMMIVMPTLMTVDPLSGDTLLPYLPPPTNNKNKFNEIFSN